MLNPKFPYMPVTRSNDSRRVRKRQCRALLDKQFDNAANIHLFIVPETEKPGGELVNAFNLPSLTRIMP